MNVKSPKLKVPAEYGTPPTRPLPTPPPVSELYGRINPPTFPPPSLKGLTKKKKLLLFSSLHSLNCDTVEVFIVNSPLNRPDGPVVGGATATFGLF